MSTLTPNYNLEKPEASDPFGNFRQSYNDNLDIIDANLGGGGGGNVDDVEVNGVSVVDANKIAKITSYKEVTQAEYDALPAIKLTDGIAYFIKDGGGSGSGGSFLLVITADTGETVTATKDGATFTATEVSTGVYEVEVTSAGTWTLSDGTNTATVDVGIYTATLSSVPEGSTVIPTDDVSIWLACGERTEGYTTLSQVLGDSVCLSALLSNNNANDYLVRSTTWASTVTADSSAMTYIGLNNYCANTLLSDTTWRTAICNSAYFESVLNAKVPVMTSNTTPEGLAFAYGELSSYEAYKAFDNNDSTFWQGRPAVTNGTIGYCFDIPVNICKAKYRDRYGNKQVTVSYSDNGTDYTVISDTATITSGDTDYYFNMNGFSSHRYWRANIATSESSFFYVQTLQFYGRKDI